MVPAYRIVRAVLAVIAVGVVVLALTRGHDVRSCDGARREAFALAVDRGAPPPLDEGRGLAARLIAVCRGSDGLAPSAQALVLARALDGAELVAQEAIARDPDAFQAHNALASVLEARGDAAGAQRERGEARRLNPLAPVPPATRVAPDG
ncbi:hypothetical protein [Paraconexibacter sp.]|uniref:hypothetical protein n=1 Tax=Paraconexibacter sp. TaxID=2949640 RepID=UPI003561A564